MICADDGSFKDGVEWAKAWLRRRSSLVTVNSDNRRHRTKARRPVSEAETDGATMVAVCWPDIWSADLEQERANWRKELAADYVNAVSTWPKQWPALFEQANADANAVTQPAIDAGQELIDCADGKKRTAADKQAWEARIWEQLRLVQG